MELFQREGWLVGLQNVGDGTEKNYDADNEQNPVSFRRSVRETLEAL